VGRSFSFDHQGRSLCVRPIAVDEGWELWVMEGEERLVCGCLVTVEEAVLAGRQGHDRIRAAADELREQVVVGKILLGISDRTAA
jgi:hypothetical protein